MVVVIRDILFELSHVGDLPLPQPSPETRNKRARDNDSLDSNSNVQTSPSISSSSDSMNGGRPLSRDAPPPPYPTAVPSSGQMPQQTVTQTCILPMYTDELGRLPLHGPFNLSDHSRSPMHQSDFSIGTLSPLDNHLFSTNTSSTSSPFGTSLLPPFSDVPTQGLKTADMLMPRGISPRHYQDQGLVQPTDHLWGSPLPSDASFSQPDTTYGDTAWMWSNAPTTFGCVPLGILCKRNIQ